MKNLKVAFLTVGCRANQADTARMISALPPEAEPVDVGSEQCDAIVINTCAVTSRAEADGRKLIRRARRRHPDAGIIVTGCAAQVKPEIWAAMPEVDCVIGITEREHLEQYLAAPAVALAKAGEPTGGVTGPTPMRGHRSRPFLKIQDGCTRGCTYCIVPLARGPERSRPAEMVREDILRLSEAGYPEIVLTGVHLGRWGCDLESAATGRRAALPDLLDTLEGIRADVRLRLSSIEPMDLTPDLVRRILTHPLICPHLHIPLQSGDESILKAMGRNHPVTHYAELLEAAKSVRPDAGLGADIMVGFPGEDDKAFRNTFNFVSKQPFTYLHIFTFSPRPLTPAADLPARPPGGAVRDRMKTLKELDRVKRQAFQRALHGQTRPFLIESPPLPSGDFTALSDNYVRVHVRAAGCDIPVGQVVLLVVDTNYVKDYGMPAGILE